jgi:hypothetical protein
MRIPSLLAAVMLVMLMPLGGNCTQRRDHDRLGGGLVDLTSLAGLWNPPVEQAMIYGETGGSLPANDLVTSLRTAAPGSWPARIREEGRRQTGLYQAC